MANRTVNHDIFCNAELNHLILRCVGGRQSRA
jgi:hypothetical protein